MDKKILLEKMGERLRKTYWISRILIFSLFFSSLCVFGYKTLFPSSQFIFFFKTPDASKNTLIDPRRTDGEKYRSGKISASDGLVFDAPLEELVSEYSRIKVRLSVEKSSGAPRKAKVRKSYQAFFYPQSGVIESAQSEPTAGINFLDSPLFSYGDAVYVVDGKDVRPFNSVETFQSLGYDWQDVKAAQGDEFMKYEKGKLFTAAHPHPDGTIFVDREDAKYFLISGNKKFIVSDKAWIESNLRHNPILVDSKSLEEYSQCQLEKRWSLFIDNYSCDISIDNLKDLAGNDYQFEIESADDYKIKEARIVLDKSFNWNNLRKSLSDIRKRIIQNYVSQD